jgi:predicted Fe-Mo cluster-binding NifX family protein
MIIAIPLTGNHEFSSHFGGAAKVGLYEVDVATRSIVRTSVAVPPDPEPCGWAAWLTTQDVKVVLAGGMGGGARQRMAAAGIEVVAGVAVGEPRTLVQAWLDGSLVPGANACEGGHHGHGHEHGDHGHPHHHGEHGHQPGHGCTCGAH